MSQSEQQLTLLSTPEVVDKEQAEILKHLSRSPRHIDEIYRDSGMSMPDVSSTLTLLELHDLVRQVGGMHYVLTREAHALYQSHVSRDEDAASDADLTTSSQEM